MDTDSGFDNLGTLAAQRGLDVTHIHVRKQAMRRTVEKQCRTLLQGPQFSGSKIAACKTASGNMTQESAGMGAKAMLIALDTNA
jgi:hypothetical protein